VRNVNIKRCILYEISNVIYIM